MTKNFSLSWTRNEIDLEIKIILCLQNAAQLRLGIRIIPTRESVKLDGKITGTVGGIAPIENQCNVPEPAI